MVQRWGFFRRRWRALPWTAIGRGQSGHGRHVYLYLGRVLAAEEKVIEEGKEEAGRWDGGCSSREQRSMGRNNRWTNPAGVYKKEGFTVDITEIVTRGRKLTGRRVRMGRTVGIASLGRDHRSVGAGSMEEPLHLHRGPPSGTQRL